MPQVRVLVVFDGHEDGLVERMARKVAEGVRGAGAEALTLAVKSAKPEDAMAADAVIIGSPCHFGGPSAAVKKFMDSTWPIRGKLAGKVGAVFAASEHLAGGHELTMISCLAFFLSHGMVVEGSDKGDAFGAIVVAPEGDKSEAVADDPEECRRLGEKAARLASRLKR